VEVGDVIAMFNLGCFYSKGLYGVQRNRAKALELYYHRAEEFGFAKAYNYIGYV
jgi:TPR repeat protein